MENRLKDIKEVLHAKVYGPAISDVSWLVSEVERLRAARITDLESVVSYGKHLGATEHILGFEGLIEDKIIWKAHKLAMALRFNETGEKCPGCGGFRWVHE